MDENVKELIQGLFPLDGMEAEGFCVSSRALHQILGAKTKYADWIKNRIVKYGFEEDIDFIQHQPHLKLISEFSEIKDKRGGDRRSVDYLFTTDMAKELAMIENTPVSKQVRNYFIQCEKTLRTIAPEVTEELQQQILATESLMQSEGTLSLAEIAQLLGKGRNRYAKELRGRGVLKSNNTPYQKHIEAGHFELKLVEVRNRIIPVTRVTAKGAIYLQVKERL